MRTKATVKNYNMEIIGYDGNRLKGNWTGGVRTKVQNSYITIPVLAAYKLSPRTTLKLGPYFSYLMDGDFSGHVYEGYLRETNPTGDKINFTNGAIATTTSPVIYASSNGEFKQVWIGKRSSI